VDTAEEELFTKPVETVDNVPKGPIRMTEYGFVSYEKLTHVTGPRN